MTEIFYSIKQLHKYANENKGMVFIDGKYQTVQDLAQILGRRPRKEYQLQSQNSICSLHLIS